MINLNLNISKYYLAGIGLLPGVVDTIGGVFVLAGEPGVGVEPEDPVGVVGSDSNFRESSSSGIGPCSASYSFQSGI